MATLAEGDQRHQTYAALMRRNRSIGRLRVLVPLIGVIVLFALVAQIWVASIAKHLSISGLSFDKGVLTVDAPRFTGSTETGATFVLSADEAHTRATDPHMATLDGITGVLDGKDGYKVNAWAPSGKLALAQQVLTVTDTMSLVDSRGAHGRLVRPVIDWPNKTVTTTAPVTFDFANGATLTAASMHYEAGTGDYHFTDATLTLPPDEGLPK